MWQPTVWQADSAYCRQFGEACFQSPETAVWQVVFLMSSGSTMSTSCVNLQEAKRVECSRSLVSHAVHKIPQTVIETLQLQRQSVVPCLGNKIQCLITIHSHTCRKDRWRPPLPHVDFDDVLICATLWLFAQFRTCSWVRARIHELIHRMLRKSARSHAHLLLAFVSVPPLVYVYFRYSCQTRASRAQRFWHIRRRVSKLAPSSSSRVRRTRCFFHHYLG